MEIVVANDGSRRLTAIRAAVRHFVASRRFGVWPQA
jgi:hypothetical protein